MGNARERSGAFVIGYIPTIKSNEFDFWSSYAIENQDWVKESWQVYQGVEQQDKEHQMVESFTQDVLMGDDTLFLEQIWQVVAYRDEDGNAVMVDTSTCNNISSDSAANIRTEQVLIEPSNEPASPLWTVSPPPNPNDRGPNPINFNMRSDKTFQDAVSIIEQHRTSTFHNFCSLGRTVSTNNYMVCLINISNKIIRLLLAIPSPNSGLIVRNMRWMLMPLL
jgi:hypothetical protein